MVHSLRLQIGRLDNRRHLVSSWSMTAAGPRAIRRCFMKGLGTGRGGALEG
jgi:hypothetical protein